MAGSLFGGESKQKLLFFPNVTNLEDEYEISETALFRFLLNEETKEIEVAEMLNALSDIDKLSKITEFETYRSSMGSVTDGSKAFHVFIVFRTTSKKDGDYWWSLEKNLKYIVLQRSRSKTVVKDKLKGKERNRVKPIIENLKGKGSIRNLFAILWAHQIIEEKYHIMNSNCQSLVTLVGKQITEEEYEYKGVFKFSLRENDRDTEMLDLINLLTNAFDKQHPLFSLIFHEDTSLFDIVMESGKYDINDLITTEGFTPLQLAIILSKTKMVQHLLDKWKADPTKKGKPGMNALPLAIIFAKENMDIIDLLLAHEKVDIDEGFDEHGFTALHIAIVMDNFIAVKHLIDNGADPNISANKSGQTPLHLAARCGMGAEIIDLILKAKNNEGIDDVDDESAFGFTEKTALYMAAGASHEIIAEYLIKKGVDLNYRDKFGRTPLHWFALKAVDKTGENPLHYAKDNKHGLGETIANRLKEKGAVEKMKKKTIDRVEQFKKLKKLQDDWSREVLERSKVLESFLTDDKVTNDIKIKKILPKILGNAIADSNVEKVRHLIETEIDINKVTLEEEKGLNALHKASYHAKTTELIDVILETEKFDINGGDNKGQTPLHHAILGHNSTINARHLIEKGADPTVRDNKGTTSLQFAAFCSKETDILDLLLTNEKVDINERNKNGYTALHLAVGISNVTSVRWLLSKGAHPSIADENGWTPLHCAAMFAKDMDIVELLMSHKDVNINYLNNKGRTALYYAIKDSNVEIVRILIEKELDFKKPQWGEKGINALHLASKCAKTTELIDVVLENGQFDISQGDNDGHTPLHYAIKGINPAINVRYLIEEKGADPNISDKNGVTPLQLAAAEAKTMDLIDLFLNNDVVDVNHRDNHGRNALVHALLNENGLRDKIIVRLKENCAKEL